MQPARKSCRNIEKWRNVLHQVRVRQESNVALHEEQKKIDSCEDQLIEKKTLEEWSKKTFSLLKDSS